MTHVALVVIVAASLALMLVRPRGIAEVWWVGGGALLLVALRLVTPALALRAAGKGADVYFFLTGMMLLSELSREVGVFDWVSSLAVRGARGSCARLFAMVYAVGTVVTVFLSNDATAVVLTPAIFAAVRKAKVEPLPHLFACAFVANAASFVLPISNPANLVVFQDRMPPLGAWLLSFGVPSALSIATTYLVLRWWFRRDIEGPIDQEADPVALSEQGRWVVAGLGSVVVVLLVASALDADLGLPTLGAAVTVTGAVSAFARRDPLPLLRRISWGTLALVAALFVMVDAVVSVGALELTRSLLGRAAALPTATGALVTGGVVAVANNVVNNLPLGLIAGATVRAARPSETLVRAVLVGVDLGPNLSVTGSLATILWLIALRREKLEVGFWQFLKVGAVAMPLALVVSVVGVIVVAALGVG